MPSDSETVSPNPEQPDEGETSESKSKDTEVNLGEMAAASVSSPTSLTNGHNGTAAASDLTAHVARLDVSSNTLDEEEDEDDDVGGVDLGDMSRLSEVDLNLTHHQNGASSSMIDNSPVGHSSLGHTLRTTKAKEDPDESLPILPSNQKPYDYLLKVLLVGDSDVGKQEILAGLEDGTTDSPFCSSSGAAFKTTTILIDGKRVKLQLWDTSGQGRFCTIIRSYSRGAQGILLVYDITSKWSFEGINRWLKEVDQVRIFAYHNGTVLS